MCVVQHVGRQVFNRLAFLEDELARHIRARGDAASSSALASWQRDAALSLRGRDLQRLQRATRTIADLEERNSSLERVLSSCGGSVADGASFLGTAEDGGMAGEGGGTGGEENKRKSLEERFAEALAEVTTLEEELSVYLSVDDADSSAIRVSP